MMKDILWANYLALNSNKVIRKMFSSSIENIGSFIKGFLNKKNIRLDDDNQFIFSIEEKFKNLWWKDSREAQIFLLRLFLDMYYWSFDLNYLDKIKNFWYDTKFVYMLHKFNKSCTIDAISFGKLYIKLSLFSEKQHATNELQKQQNEKKNQQNDLLKQISSSLWDSKLDYREVGFLSSQDNLLVDFDTDLWKQLLTDIINTNERYLSWDKTKAFINFAITNFDGFMNQLDLWISEYVKNSIKRHFKELDYEKQKWVIINMLLSNFFLKNQDTPSKFKVAFQEWWSFIKSLWTENKGNVSSDAVKSFLEQNSSMSADTVRMLHAFQSKTNKNLSARSKVDCIIWPLTIQQLFSYNNISFQDLEGVGEFSIGDEFKQWYVDKVLDKDTYTWKLNKLLFYKEKLSNKTIDNKKQIILSMSELMLEIYNWIKSNDDFKNNFLSFLEKTEMLVYITNEIDKVWWFFWIHEKVQLKNRINTIFNQIPELHDTYNEDWTVEVWVLNERFRPQWKLNQLGLIIDMWKVWEWYMSSLHTSDNEIAIIRENITDSLNYLEWLYAWTIGDGRIDNVDLNEYIDKIFISHDIISPSKHLNLDVPVVGESMDALLNETRNKSIIKRNKNLVSIRQILSGWKTLWYLPNEVQKQYWKDSNIERYRVEVLELIRKVDRASYSKFYSWDAILSELSEGISKMRFDGTEYTELNNSLKQLDDLLNNDEKMDELFWLLSDDDLFLPDKSLNVRVLKFFNSIGFDRNWDDSEILALYAELEEIKEQNLIIKSETEKRIKKEYKQNQSQIKRNIEVLDKQISQTSEWSENYWEYVARKKVLEAQLEACESFLGWNKLQEIKTDDDWNIILNESWEIELCDTKSDDWSDITIASMCDIAYNAANEVAFRAVAASTLGLALLEYYEDDVDKISKKVDDWKWNITLHERKLKLIDDIEWIWKWWSDSTFNTILDVTKEVLIEVAICVVSMWVGNALSAGLRWVYHIWKGLIKSINMAKSVKKLSTVSKLANNTLKVGKYWKNLKFVDKTWRVVKTFWNATKPVWKALNKMVTSNVPKKITKLAIEWTWFHVSSTFLHNVINENPLSTWINPFWYEMIDGEKVYNWKWYVQSIVFLWVLKWVWVPLQNLSANIVSKAVPATLSGSLLESSLVQVSSVLAETWLLMWTDQGLRLIFDPQSFWEMSTTEFIHMVGMVIWLRAYGAINKKLGLSTKGLSDRVDERVAKKFSVKNGKGELILQDSNWKEYRVTEDQINEGFNNLEKIQAEKANVKPINKEVVQVRPESNKVSVDNTAKNISNNRFLNWKNEVNDWIPTEIQLRPDAQKIRLERNGKYKKILDEYDRLIRERPEWYEKRLEELDFMLAERVTLDNWFTVEYANEWAANKSFAELKKTYPESELRKFETWDGKSYIRIKTPQEMQLESNIKDLRVKQAELEAKRKNVIWERPRETSEWTIRDIELVLSHGNKLSINWAKHKYIGIKDGKMQFKPDAWWEIKEFSSLKELQNANVNFELKNTPKINGKGKNQVFQEIVNRQEWAVKKRPWEVAKQIENLNAEKSRLENEIHNIETNNNNYNQNEFFAKNKQELVGENFWRDWEKHTIINVTENGDLRITNNKTWETFTINSFKQLSDRWWIQFFAEQWANPRSTELTRAENNRQKKWETLKEGEREYVSNRKTELWNKKRTLDQINKDIANKNIEYEQSKDRQKQIDSRRDKLEGVNKELNKVNNELQKKEAQLENEFKRWDSKYDFWKSNEPAIVENVPPKSVEANIEQSKSPKAEPQPKNVEQAKAEPKVENNPIKETKTVDEVIALKQQISKLEAERKNVEDWTVVDESTKAKRDLNLERINKEISKLERQYKDLPKELKSQAEIEVKNREKQEEIEAERNKEIQRNNEIQKIENNIRSIEAELRKSDYDLWTERRVRYMENREAVEEAWRRSRESLEQRKRELQKQLQEKQGKVKEVEPVKEQNEAIKSENSGVDWYNQQIKYLEQQRAETERQYKNKKNPTQDDIKTYKENMDAYEQKIQDLKARKAIVESQTNSQRRVPQIDQYNVAWNKVKIVPKSWESLEQTVNRALNNKSVDKLVVVENWEVFMVNSKITTSQKIEVRFENWVIEVWPRKNGKLEWYGTRVFEKWSKYEGMRKEWKMEWDGILVNENGNKYEWKFKNNQMDWQGRLEYDGVVSEWLFREWKFVEWTRTVTSTWDVYKWEFRLNDLRDGKIIAKDWKVVKEYVKWKEKANFENVKSFEELYNELDRVWEIVVENKGLFKNTETKYTSKQVKEMIKRWELRYLPKELRVKVETLNNLKFDVNRCSNVAQEFVKEFGEPTNKIELWDWSVLHVTDILQQQWWYKFIIWYASYKGKLEPRIFYRSFSEWCRRACPWRRRDWKYSKAEFLNNQSYETTTKVDPRVWNKFDKFNIKKTYEDVVKFSEKRFWTDFLQKQVIEEIRIDQKMFDNYNSAADFYGWRLWQDVVNAYNNLVPKWLDYKNMVIVKQKEYSYKHDFLWDVNVTVCRTKFNWKDVDIHFSRAKNDRRSNDIWIENIVYSDAKINSFGVYDKQINAWPLTAKPLDYIGQVPNNFKGNNWEGITSIDPNYVYKDYSSWKSYVDIRELYQWNPIIKYAKENILSKAWVNM